MNRTWVYIGIGVLAIGGTIAFVSYRRKKQLEKQMKSTDTSVEGALGKPQEVYEAGSEEQGSVQYKKSEKITPTTLIIGSKGRPVGLIQAWMNFKYGANVKVDGRFGQELRDALRDELGWWCGSYGMGDSSCTIKSTDTPAKEALAAMKTKNKQFMDYFMKVYPAVGREFEPVTWGGIAFSAKY